MTHVAQGGAEQDDATGTYGSLAPLMKLVEALCEDYEPLEHDAPRKAKR